MSHEEDVTKGHTIEPDGYDIGRDELVAAATDGQTSYNGVTYSTTQETVTGLLKPGTDGINHGSFLLLLSFRETNGEIADIAIDGNVILLTVSIV